MTELSQPTDPTDREKEIFNQALELDSPEAREAFLKGACSGDVALRAQIDTLLEAFDSAEGFLPTKNDIETTLAEKPISEDSGSVIGRYKLLEKLGEGGFGSVWAAEQKEPVRRRVALKIIKLGMDTQQVVARFEAERQALALMDHPNIAKVLDAGATNTGRPYFVMELVKGMSITHYCDQEKLSSETRLDLFIKVCHAIQHAHQKGIIHRDIKPSNIMVTLHDGVPVPKVIDFGIAKATQQELTEKTIYTQYSQFIGTPAYMSPEQAEMSGLDIDTRSDIYSLGVLLYELLTGSTPFDTKELMQSGLDEMRKIIREREPIRPSTKLSQTLEVSDGDEAGNRFLPISTIDRDLDWIVMKCLEKERGRRYDAANDLAMELKRYLSNEPVIARPPSVIYRWSMLWKRNKVLVTAAGVATAAVLLGLAVSVGMFLRERDARAEANSERAKAKERQTDAEAARDSERNMRVQAQESARLARKAEDRVAAAEQRALLQAYVSDIRRAQTELSIENIQSTRGILERHRPNADETDYRGWEWRWLWQQIRPNALFQLTQAPGRIDSLSASHDGRLLAFLDGRRRFQIWDVIRREQIVLPESEYRILGIRFSPTRSEFAILAGEKDSKEDLVIQIGNTSNMTFERSWPLPMQHHTMLIKYSGNGQYLVGVSETEGAPVTVWETATGNLRALQTIEVDSTDHNGGWAITSTASHIATGDGGLVRVHDLKSGDEIWQTQATSDTLITALAFSADDKILASGHGFSDGVIRIWDAQSGSKVKDDFIGHRMGVTDLEFGPEGESLISASWDQTIRVWDLVSCKQNNLFRGQGSQVRRIVSLPNTGLIASAGARTGVYVWDLDEGVEARRAVDRPDQVKGYWFHSNDKTVWTVNKGGDIREWETRTMKPTGRSRILGQAVEATLYSPLGNLLVTQNREGLVVWDLNSDRMPQPIALTSDDLYPIGFTDQDRHLLIFQSLGEDRQRIIEWDLALNQELRSWQISLGFNPYPYPSQTYYHLTDGGAAISGPHDGSYQQIDLITGIATSMFSLETINLGERGFWGSSISPDHRHAAVIAGRSCILMHSNTKFPNGVIQTKEIGSEGSMWIHGIAISPDSQQLALGSNSYQAIRLWRLDAQEQVLTLQGKGSVFENLSFSPDGRCIASTNNDGLFHLWRAPSWEEIKDAETKNGL